MNTSKCKNRDLANEIFTQRIDARIIELEYRRGSNTCLKRVYGEAEKVALTSSYVKQLENQLNTLDEELLPLFNSSIRSHFKVKVRIKSNGEFDLENLKLEIRVDFSKCDGVNDIMRRVRKNLLPFAENINSVQVFGNKHVLTYSLADMMISLENLIMILEDKEPIIAPRAEVDWGLFYRHAITYAKDSFNYDLKVPCIEGELLWDTAEICVQVQDEDYLKRKTAGGK